MANSRNGNRNLRASSNRMDGFTGKALITLFVFMFATIFLLPLAYMSMNSLKTTSQITEADILPWSPVTVTADDDPRDLNVYEVIMPDGSVRELGLFDNAQVGDNIFIDPETKEEVLWDADDVASLQVYRDPDTNEWMVWDVGEAEDSRFICKLSFLRSVFECTGSSGDADWVVSEDGETVTHGATIWNVSDFDSINTYRDLETMRDADGERIQFEYIPIKHLKQYDVPMPDGSTRRLAGVKDRGKQVSEFLDYGTGEIVEWDPSEVDDINSFAQLEPIVFLDSHPENYVEVWDALNFLKLLRNTIVIAGLGIIGTVLSCSAVAYGFTRFPIPFKNTLFLILISTIILPKQVTLIPTYFLFQSLGWTGRDVLFEWFRWLPLIVPHFFANAYNVFLLRQYFLTIPKDLDEAAYMDGATPMQVLFKVILPQSMPAIVAVSLFHLIFAWNDYFEPLIYLGGNQELAPLALGFGQFTLRYSTRPDLLMAASFLALAVPIFLFFLAQRYFMQGVVFTGVK